MSTCITKEQITALRDIVNDCKAVLYEWLIRNKKFVLSGIDTNLQASFTLEAFTTSTVTIPDDLDLQSIVQDLGFNVE